MLAGYERAFILDAACTGRHPVGTVFEIDPDALVPVPVPSPHFAGLPELLELARRLDLPFPRQFRIFAVEVQDPVTVGGEMAPEVRRALPELCDRVCRAIEEPGGEAPPR